MGQQHKTRSWSTKKEAIGYLKKSPWVFHCLGKENYAFFSFMRQWWPPSKKKCIFMA